MHSIGKTFVFTGDLLSMDREEAQDFVKRHQALNFICCSWTRSKIKG
jgi:BRCT domain type II-containing protein